MKKLYKLWLLISVMAIAFTGFSQNGKTRPPVVSSFENEILSDQILNVKPEGYLMDLTYGSSLQAGGDRLVMMQNPDGGWGWELTGPSALNTVGPIAMGLAQAYTSTMDADHLVGLSLAGSYLLTKTNNFSPSDGYLAAILDQIFAVTTYSNHVNTHFYGPLAAGTYDRSGLGVLFTTQSYIQRIRDLRSGTQANMAAWDIGMGLVGAASAGAATTDWIAGVEAEINELDGDNYYDVIGLAGALYGLAFVNEEFDPTAGEHEAASSLADLADILASYQIELGGFSWNSGWVIPDDGDEAIQETGYAILALNEVNRVLYLENIAGAANYLRSVQLGTGGWRNYNYEGTTSVENNEVTAEALWGIKIAGTTGFYNSTTGNYYASLQDAIDAADPEDVIEIAAGTVLETGQISISKNLTIKGEIGGKGLLTTITPGSNTTVGGNVPSEAFIYIAPGVTATLQDFIIDCAGWQINHAIQSRGNLTVNNCEIKNVKWGQYNGRGIVLFSGTNLIQNVSFSNIERIGIHVRGNVTTPNPVATIEDITYVGKGIEDWLDYAIEFGGGGQGTVDNLNASNCLGVASVDGSTSAGVLVTDYFGTGTTASISNSFFDNNTTGIVVGYAPGDGSVCSVSHCTFGDGMGVESNRSKCRCRKQLLGNNSWFRSCNQSLWTR